jgi:hypothetical protein
MNTFKVGFIRAVEPKRYQGVLRDCTGYIVWTEALSQPTIAAAKQSAQAEQDKRTSASAAK